jgi:hypothetical protein
MIYAIIIIALVITMAIISCAVTRQQAWIARDGITKP